MDWFSKDTFTAVAAGVAAFTGLWTWYQGLRVDRILVARGDKYSLDPDRDGVTVENRSKDKVNLSDWGLIQADGKLYSLREHDLESQGFDDSTVTRGTADGLPPKGQFVHTISFGREVVGAYATASSHRFRRITLSKKLPLRLKLTLWWRHFRSD